VTPPRHRPSEQSRSRTWLIGLAALAALGVAVSTAVALAWRASTTAQARQSFNAEAASVGSTVTTALRRLDDLTIAARVIVATDPNMSNRELATWYRGMGVRSRYPGTLGFGYVERVDAPDLPLFGSTLRDDPVPHLRLPAAGLSIFPPGRRRHYCLIRLGIARGIAAILPGAGYDLCAIPGSSSFLPSAESGRVGAISAQLPGLGQVLVVSAPVYGGVDTPELARGRETLFLGWMVGVFDLRSVLGGAVASDRHLAVSITRGPALPEGPALAPPPAARLTPVAEAGARVAGAAFRRTFELDADGRWQITVARKPSWGPITPDLQAGIVFAAGLALTVLLGLFGLVLLRGKQHALRLVARKTEELRHQALHDALTGLPNRALILDRAAQALARTRREHGEVAAMYLDLDGFKGVNDTFGHPAGDELLQGVATRLANVLRESETIGRLGGDEFVVLVESDAVGGRPELVAERILDVLAEPFALEAVPSSPIAVTASIGIATGDRESASDLLRDADIALYEAKAAGRNRYVLFRQEMHAAAQGRLALETDLRAALPRGELFLDYQPTFDLGETSLVGAEALIRWRHPTRGLMSPGEFIPLAEDTGLIVPIGRWVLETACTQAGAWHRSGYPIEISVNVSAIQLDDPAFGDVIAASLEAAGLEPRFLILEITESLLMRNPEETSVRLRDLKALGVRIAIDDFGTGYSSLAYLQQFPVDALKLDKSFISGVASSSESRAVIRTLVQLGKTLKLDTVAEGIEDAAQLAQLRDEECERGQGYLLARPLAPQAMQSLLERAWRAQGPRPARPPLATPRPRPAT
jgi:diguanylate cyclase (GGDEF)-like protein